jgi:tRNA/tmRNA/rRNA uracil-C5-methylase (TrmA/RlmC/RlmD family)
MPRSNRSQFPGARRPPANLEPDDSAESHGRRGRRRPGGYDRRPGKGWRESGKPQDRVPAQAEDGKEIRFADLLMQLARRAKPELVQGGNHPEPLSRLDYELELDLKNKALQEFWTARGLPDKPNRILPSPRPRGYRTTTKRRVIQHKGRFELSFMTESSAAASPKAGAESLVEPREHKAIYAFILSKLNTPAYSGLAHALNYLIIRGGYSEFTVLFNVHRLNADVVRKAKLLGDHFKELETKVASAFMFFDPSRSEFYFEARNPEGPWKIKKIFGPDEMRLKVLDRTYAFHPTSFCQVNASILPTFLEKADQLLKPKPEYRLLDLYSGFGFFTLHLGPRYGEALGVDLGHASIESAQRMAAAAPGSHCRFRSGRIQAKNLEKLLPPATADKPEALLLDPPRQGTEPGVIRALAARNPARILHIFCDMDTLPKEVNQWRKAGFMVSKAVPLDMFPGTEHLEVMVLFIPDRYGILNRIDKAKAETRPQGDDDVLLQDEGFAPRPGRKNASYERPSDFGKRRNGHSGGPRHGGGKDVVRGGKGAAGGPGGPMRKGPGRKPPRRSF